MEKKKKSKKKLILNSVRIVLFLAIAWLISSQLQMKDSYTDKAGEVHFGTITRDPDETFLLFNGDRIERSEVEEVKEGLRTIFGKINVWLVLLAGLLWFPVPLLTVWRWQVLLKIQGVRVSFWGVVKLTYIGTFFNNVIPGLTGGDVVKAYYIAKQTHKKTETVMTVVLDRMIGMAGLIAVCSIALVFKLGDDRFREFALYILAVIAIGVAALAVFFTDSIRNALGVNKIKSMLPFQKIVHEIDEAILIYKKHVPTVLLLIGLSMGVHVGVSLLNYVLGGAIGITQMAFMDYMIAVPILLTIMAIPIAPAGWGVGELAYGMLLPLWFPGVTANRALTLSVTSKLIQLIWSLPGGVLWLTGGHKVSAKELMHEIEEAEHEMAEAEV